MSARERVAPQGIRRSATQTSGVRAGHDGRQWIPVVVTPTRKSP
jgi:hypothetical protein